MQGEAAPAFPAAATGCPARLPRRATLRRAWPALGRLLPRPCAKLALGEKPERQGKSAPVTDI